jgi:DNA invertase Pin-like site-specific DNA recombinase
MLIFDYIRGGATVHENNKPVKNTMNEKDRIRMRYQGINPDEIDLIPALPQENFYEDHSEKRVAIYVRVSTDDLRQTSSYELQKNHYTDMVNHHEGWILVEIYADEGISGTSLKNRKAFIKMIEDCKAGKIDLIVTKTVARFARNTLDCIGHIRMLAALKQPVGVLFETEGLYTLDSRSEMPLSFISILAQEESRNKSEIINSSIEMRFRRGIFLTPPLLGYDHDEDGNLVINDEEAKTVRLAFFMYLYGYTCQQIAESFTNLRRKTKKNNVSWSPSSILQILQNERHCGDVLARKTWTPNFLDHKAKKNKQNRNQYRKTEHHEAIILRDDFIAVQRLISNAKYGNKGILPELKVISEGALKGFVSVNPRWAAFNADDYRTASVSVYDEPVNPPSKPLEVKVESGDFDLRGYEIARSQFFDITRKVCVTFSKDSLWFSTECTRKFEGTYIEMLVHPREQLLAVRPSAKDVKNAVRWQKIKEDYYCPRTISGTAFLSTLYKIFGWKIECRYRVRGIHRLKDNEAVIIFDMRETEIFIPDAVTENYFSGDIQPLVTGLTNNVIAYPPSWANDFGYNYYRHAQARELASIGQDGTWNIAIEAKPFVIENGLNVTKPDIIASSITQIINNIEQGGTNVGDEQ